MFKLGKMEDQIVALLKASESPMTLMEMAEKLGKPPKRVFKSLRKLFGEGKVSCDMKSRRYMLTKE